MFHRHDHEKCWADALNTAEALCSANGARLTDQRKQVLGYIWESHKPIKAYEILEKIAAESGKVQPPTVYRALDFLIENKLIHRIDSLNAFTGCHHPEAGHDCFFLICTECGNADECCSPDLKSAISNTSDAHRFNINRITLEVSGQCEHCQQT